MSPGSQDWALGVFQDKELFEIPASVLGEQDSDLVKGDGIKYGSSLRNLVVKAQNAFVACDCLLPWVARSNSIPYGIHGDPRH